MSPLRLGLWLALAALPLAAEVARAGPERIRHDPRFDALVPPDARLERIASGHGWLEGPVWNDRERSLLFSDVARNVVLRWREGNGVHRFLAASGYTGAEPFQGREPGSNGLAFDPLGRLILCAHGDRSVVRLEADGRRTVLADGFEGSRLNSPNDVVVRANGELYFTDPPFGLPQGFEDPAKELPFSGIYRLDADARLTLLSDQVRAPNGLAFSPDEKTLYVSNSDSAQPLWLAFAVERDGTLAAPRVFFDATAWARRWPGLPDGMKVDRAGNLFAAGPGGVHVFAPDGTPLGSLLTGVATSNVAFGGNGSDLFVTASDAVYRVRVATAGPGVPASNPR